MKELFDISFDNGDLQTAVIILLSAGLLIILMVLLRSIRNYSRLRRRVSRQEEEKRDVAERRRIPYRIKQAVLERDDYTCQICGISKGFFDELEPGLGDYLLLEIDHIESVARGGTGMDEDNLQVLCWRCNRKKGSDKTNEDVRMLIDYGVEYLDI